MNNLADELAIKGLKAPELSRRRQFYSSNPEILGALTQKLSDEPKQILGSLTQEFQESEYKGDIPYFIELLKVCSYTHFIELIKIQETIDN